MSGGELLLRNEQITLANGQSAQFNARQLARECQHALTNACARHMSEPSHMREGTVTRM